MNAIKFFIGTLLLSIILLGGHASADDHDHEEGEHAHEELWHGVYHLEQATYTLSLQRQNEEYVDSSLKVVLVPMPEAFEESSSAVEKLEEQVDAFELVADKEAASTLMKVSVTVAGEYVVFANHNPSEWEAGDRKLFSDIHGESLSIEGSAACASSMDSSRVWGLSMLGAFLGAVMSLSGALIIAPIVQMKQLGILKFLNSFACGVLISLVLVHLIPEAGALFGALDWRVSTTVTAGYFAGLLIEHGLKVFLQTHEQGAAGSGGGSTVAEMVQVRCDLQQKMEAPQQLPYVTESSVESACLEEAILCPHGRIGNVLIADFFHNFFDGVTTAIAFKYCGPELGWIVVGAAIVHELPQELSDFVILRTSGMSTRWALISNFASSLSCILGVIVILASSDSISSHISKDMGLLLAFGAGLLLYIAAGLVPEILVVDDLQRAAVHWLVRLLMHDVVTAADLSPPLALLVTFLLSLFLSR
ncbi:hypothetical protein GUITHDRAFT_122350 [Guillardia theta CCMP2712]|uniref:Uncharacterized protein n=1 Tax=Guillardia theta (strain CCMP2712) TaxID=905079 RepID=L1I5V6_GUITC|nr:hypothetical protein GUITHDRAFT_122350 [Guillardia theta CCMP2712]EKX31462.1 hypothetical protein GUITHDRAFT_122350 [Guillardia theta CCMP2712]|eukprot:XP_005818442.1 hypothetical protein GUITHDRAFT_122350 [Guillardia theta CCMP2712]